MVIRLSTVLFSQGYQGADRETAEARLIGTSVKFVYRHYYYYYFLK